MDHEPEATVLIEIDDEVLREAVVFVVPGEPDTEAALLSLLEGEPPGRGCPWEIVRMLALLGVQALTGAVSSRKYDDLIAGKQWENN